MTNRPAEAEPEFTVEDFARFLIEYPLYRKCYVQTGSLLNLLPEHLYFDCEQCGRTQPFRSVGSDYVERTEEEISREMAEMAAQSGQSTPFGGMSVGRPYRVDGVYLIRYLCSICNLEDRWWFVELHNLTRKVKRTARLRRAFIRKIGQLPPLDFPVPKDIEKKFGEASAELYRKAGICISQGYGIGACIYLRRLVENQINLLLQIYLETRTAEGASEDEIRKIQNIINEKILENKIKLVTAVEPGTNINPVGAMYDRLSEAIHTYDDNDSTGVAMDVSEMFIDLIVRLKELEKTRREYLERLQRIRQGRRQP